ncbi:hypothetical protein BH23CHL2_BH23CHL2_08340 [soil metagenome]
MIRFHDLRHTAATLLLQSGTHSKIVSEVLGPSKITLTLDTYSHVIHTVHEVAANAMDALFGSQGAGLRRFGADLGAIVN